MTIQDIISASASAAGVIIVLLLSFINIPKINLNIWEIIGSSINKNTIKKIDDLTTEVDNIKRSLDDHINENKVDSMGRTRLRILEFSSSLLAGQKPTKEHEENILEDIDNYERYCNDNPQYPNSKAVLSIKHIKSDYADRLKTHDFLDE